MLIVVGNEILDSRSSEIMSDDESWSLLNPAIVNFFSKALLLYCDLGL